VGLSGGAGLRKTRIPPVDIEALPGDLREVLEEQRKRYGAPLYPYLFYARNAAYFRAAQEMWTALQQDTTRVPGTLRALLNRRVASWTRRVAKLYGAGINLSAATVTGSLCFPA